MRLPIQHLMDRSDPVSIAKYMDVQLRRYQDADLPTLAALNRQLQEAEGRPAPPEAQLIAAQLSVRLGSDLEAVLVCMDDHTRGYILFRHEAEALWVEEFWTDRKSTRLNSSHYS